MGGFDLDAARGGFRPAKICNSHQILDQLSLLVDKSLVVADDVRGRTRYRMLETVRQYALNKLDEAGEVYAVRKRHIDYFMALLDVLGRRERAGYAQILRRGVTEFDNLRAAFAQSAKFDSDPDLLTRAARGAAWLLDLPLADRLADAAIRAGAGADANIVRAHVWSCLAVSGNEADGGAGRRVSTHELSDVDQRPARVCCAP